MVNLKTLVLTVLVMVMATVVSLRFWPSDERAIRQQVAQIETLGSKARTEKPIESLLRARQLAELFADPSTLQVEHANFTGQYPRKQIQERIVLARGFYTSATVSVHDLTIDIPKTAPKTATIHCTLRVKGEGKSQPVADVQELSAELRKINGDWLFAAVTLVEVLER